MTFCYGRYINRYCLLFNAFISFIVLLSTLYYYSQSSYSCLCFQDVLWPEFSIWNFFSAIISYQKNYQAIQAARERHAEHLKQLQYESDKKCVMETLQQNGTALHSETADVEQNIETYAKLRQERTEAFLDHVKAKHREYLELACPATCM